MRLGKMVVATAFLVASASTSFAQSGGAEITVGLGALSIISSDGESLVGIGVNNQTVRLGLPLTEKVMLEPSISLLYLSGDGASTTNLGIGAFVPFYIGESTSQGLYLAPGALVMYSSFDGEDDFFDGSTSQVAVAFEVGNKSRISDAVSLRLAGQLTLALENDDNVGSTTIQGIIGLSVRLK